MKPFYIDAPAHWASMLINNDQSETEQECVNCALWLIDNGLQKAHFIDVNDDPSYQIFDYYADGPLQTMMYTFTYFLED